MSITKILSSLLIATCSLVLSYFLIDISQTALAILSLVIGALSIIIFLHPKAVAFRFLYPGLLTFLLFMLIPMLFTIYISFTNLSTGHFLSESKALEYLTSETYLPENAKVVEFVLNKNDQGGFLISFKDDQNRTWNAIFSQADQGKTINAFMVGQTPPFAYLNSGEVFKMRDFLKSITIRYDNTNLQYFRSNMLGEIKTRYTLIAEDKILDNKTNKQYSRNATDGFFESQSEKLNPGFFTFVGLKNYLLLLKDDRIKQSFGKILSWTLIWSLATVFLTFSLGLLLALTLNQKKFLFKPLYRILLIIPYSIPFFISVLIFKGMLNKDFGIINELLATFGIAKTDWLTDPLNAKFSALMVNLWLGFPYMFLLITGILQSIPDSVYEAARMDGAGKWVTLKSITLPMVFSAIAPLLVGSFAFNLNNFVGIYLLTGGGPAIQNSITPAGETDILISYTYKLAFEGGQGQDFGMASSIALFIFIIITILTLINFRLSGMFKNNR